MRKKAFLLCISLRSEERQSSCDRLAKQTKTLSKTAPDNRQSFINKDVLSMKINTPAKQSTTLDPGLLWDLCQQTYLRGSVQCGGQAMTPESLTLPFLEVHHHQSWSTFQQYHLLMYLTGKVQWVPLSQAFHQSDIKR